MDRNELERWIGAYERAWRTPGTERLAELFSPEATYSNAPFSEPFRGLEAIAAMWEAEREGPDEPFEMDWEPIAVEGDAAVARVEVRYGGGRPQIYRDLWVIALDERGLCTAFEEWPFWPPGSDGSYAGLNTREAGA